MYHAQMKIFAVRKILPNYETGKHKWNIQKQIPINYATHPDLAVKYKGRNSRNKRYEF